MNAAPVAHRRARATLDEDERRQEDGRGEQPHDHDRVAPAGEPATRHPQDQAGQADDEAAGAHEVEPADAVRLRQLAQDESAPSDPRKGERDVEPEHPVPGDRDEHAAEHRPEHEPDRRDHRVGAHRQPELLARERVRHERGGVGEQERSANALKDPPQDQLGPAP
jgi:hypothetical protein